MRASTADLRNANLLAVYKYIYEHKEATKTEISYALRLSLPTVTQDLNELLSSSRILSAQKAEASVGRPAMLYQFNSNHHVSFGVEEAVQLWQNANIGEQVIIPLTLTQPDFTAEQLEGLLFRDLLGAQMTYYAGSTSERINNIRLAAAKLDGLILLPGESFSYNDVVGKRTEEAGFQYADAYSDGQVVPELGGGICQVSSTLYSASLYARMKTLSRTNHYFKVGYLDYGMDATVSWGGPDFKFRNDRELPVKLAAYLNEDEGSLVVEIWGTDFDGIKVQLRTTVEPVYDNEYPDVQIGNSVVTYSDMYDLDGNYLDTSRANSGVYYFHDENIEWPDGVEKRLSDAFNTNTTPERDIYM